MLSYFLEDLFWKESSPAFFCNFPKDEFSHLKNELKNNIVFQTSGSTGFPKFTVLSKEGILISAQEVNRHLNITKIDSWLLALPHYHIGGFSLFARSYLLKNRFVLFKGDWNPISFARQLKEEKITLTSLVPSQVFDLVSHSLLAPSHLRLVLVGGGACSDELLIKARSLGWKLLPTYGFTEASSQVATAPLSYFEENRSPYLNILPHCEVDTLNGRLKVRGKSILQAYLQKQNNTWILNSAKDKEGWFISSDIVEKNENQLRFIRRADNQVKILGVLVDLENLEKEISSFLNISVPLCLISTEHPRKGAEIFLFIEDLSEDFLREGLGKYHQSCSPLARIKAWHIGKLPKTALGKIDKVSLKEKAKILQSTF